MLIITLVKLTALRSCRDLMGYTPEKRESIYLVAFEMRVIVLLIIEWFCNAQKIANNTEKEYYSMFQWVELCRNYFSYQAKILTSHQNVSEFKW